MNKKLFTIMMLGGVAFASTAFAHGDDKNNKFKSMDTNNDGQVSSAEHAAGVTKMFSGMDADRDGTRSEPGVDASSGHVRQETLTYKVLCGYAEGRCTAVCGGWKRVSDPIPLRQFCVGCCAFSITKTCSVPSPGTRRNPHCSRTAVDSDGPANSGGGPAAAGPVAGKGKSSSIA